MDTIMTLLKRLPIEQLDGSIRVELENEVVLLIDGKSGSVTEGSDAQADVTLRLAEDDLRSILTGHSNVISLFTSGKIEVEGDMGLAFRLKEMLG